MSGPTGSEQWMYSSSTEFYDYTINQSLRLNDNDSAVLTFTPSSAGNRATWTWSAWVKRSNLGGNATLFCSAAGDYNLKFHTDNKIKFEGAHGEINTAAVFRDVSTWYHIVTIHDTTEGTASNRFKIYVNGVLQTTSGTYPSGDGVINSTTSHGLGGQTSANFFDGYMAEVHFLDGIANDPTTLGLGEVKDGVWIPKEYSGSHGSQGWYLPFDDSSAIGDDESANTNDFTPNNLAATDVVPDSPTNNWSTLNPLKVNAQTQTFAEGNLDFSSTQTSTNPAVTSTFAVTSGKWYWEVYIRAQGNTANSVGIASNPNDLENDTTALYSKSTAYSYQASGSKRNNADVSYGDTWTTGDIIGVALDLDAGALYFYKNGTIQNSGTAAYTSLSGEFTSYSLVYSSGAQVYNFGQDDSFAGNKTSGTAGASDDNGLGTFFHSVPSGYNSLCTSNLPDITIGPGQATQADDYFDTILYTAASSNGTHTHGSISFTPDWSWIKNRNSSERHFLTDVVRGNVSVTDKFLVSSDGSAEGANGVSGTTFSVTSSGYQFVESSIDSGELYYNSRTYVGWNWKAGGAPTTDNTNAAGAEPTAGSVKIDGVNKSGAFSGSPDIPVTRLSANTEAGFSIVKYAGVTANPIKIPHGLNSAPELLIIKRLDGGDSWMVGEPSLGFTSSNILRLEENSVVGLGNIVFTASPDANVFTVGSATNVNSNTSPYIAYCFHSVEGYSKVGTYVGGGSNFPFIYTGFRPAFVLLKKSSASGDNWSMYDNKRDTDNAVREYLIPNDTQAAGATDTMDFVSNGFKVRNAGAYINTSGATYIFLAFAEAPFKFSNAR